MRFFGTISGENRNVPRFLAVLHAACRFSEGKARPDFRSRQPIEWASGLELLLQQDRDGSVTRVHDDEVELAVAVEVCDGQSRRARPDRVGRTGGGREGSIAVPKQNGDRAVAVVGDGQIQFSAVMEIGGHNSLRSPANGYG